MSATISKAAKAPSTPVKPDAAEMQAAADRVLASFSMGESTEELTNEEARMMETVASAPPVPQDWKAYKYEDEEADGAVEGEEAQVVAVGDGDDSPVVEGAPSSGTDDMGPPLSPMSDAAAEEVGLASLARAAALSAVAEDEEELAEGAIGGAPAPVLAETPPETPPDDASDFEFEPPQHEEQAARSAMPDAPKPPMAETAQLLQRIGSIKAAADVRNWAKSASDADLLTLVSGVREVHASWLHADATLINLEVQLSIAKHHLGEADERALEKEKNVEDMKVAIQGQLGDAEGHLTTLTDEVASLQAQLAAKSSEVDSLTMSLQQAILNQKGVAEAAARFGKLSSTPQRKSTG